ncbi:hypothetical protein GFY24_32815 [Nocardia sp. SYP-A9097]|uniref:hypothetical protein n=1 Tax=Nocardia sp. SYP-A9097 TaxID=2663237 RepID=UPI00129A1715|nr:hypothetical protein [Nocardia sp. SYP-A9097]MRH92166.1 hypothetical protein [Nocardia sp. SYP-A9097]
MSGRVHRAVRQRPGDCLAPVGQSQRPATSVGIVAAVAGGQESMRCDQAEG